MHWVGDLAVECTADVESPGGSLAVRVAQGRAAIPMPVRSGDRPGDALDQRPGHGRLAANRVDRACEARASTRFSSPIATTSCGSGSMAAWSRSTRSRRTVTSGIRGPTPATWRRSAWPRSGASVRISHLRVLRDIYYIADKLDSMGHDVWYQYWQRLARHGE